MGKRFKRRIFDRSNHLDIVTNAARYNFWMIKFWSMDEKILRKIIKLMFSVSFSNCLHLGTIPYTNNLILFAEHNYISNTCISLSPTHSLLMGWRWWNNVLTTTHVTLYTYSYVIAAMLFIILPTCHIYAWSNIWVFNLPGKGRISKEREGYEGYKDSTGS